jgi:threonine/homoserine/homoserine lactone efflux protein
MCFLALVFLSIAFLLGNYHILFEPLLHLVGPLFLRWTAWKQYVCGLLLRHYFCKENI